MVDVVVCRSALVWTTYTLPEACREELKKLDNMVCGQTVYIQYIQANAENMVSDQVEYTSLKSIHMVRNS